MEINQKQINKVCPFRSQKCLGSDCAVWDDDFQCCSLKNGTDYEEEACENQDNDYPE